MAATRSPKTPAEPPRARLTRGRRAVLAGTALAAFGTALAMLPGGYNPFGPAKALVLLAGATLVALGLALEPALAAGAARRALAQRGVWPALALVGLASLATITSLDPAQSLLGHYPEYQGLALLLAASVAGFGAYSLAGDEGAWRVLGRAAVVALLVMFAYAFLQFVGADPVPWAREFVVRRVRSTPGNASNLGVIVVLALPYAVARLRTERGAWRWAAGAATAAGALTLAWSLSRGAWVGALAGALAWLLVEGRTWTRARRIRVAGVALGCVLAAIVAAALLVPNAAARLGSFGDTSAGTAGWRAEVWGATTRLVAARPVLGWGPGSFRYAFPPVRTAAMQAGETGTQVLEDPHNLFASAAVSAGVLAALALAWLLAEALAAAWALGAPGSSRTPVRDRRAFAGPALAAAVAGGIVALQFHFATLDSAPLLAVAIGLALGMRPAADTSRTTAAAPHAALRWALGAAAALLAVTALVAAGLVAADRELARGNDLLAAAAPWSEVRSAFSAAQGRAPWEPAMTWALGRAGTQYVSARRDASAGPDAIAALEAARARLPHDSLLVAQTAEAYLVTGLANRDRAALEKASTLAEQAISMDPENGYRWTTRAAALEALGDDRASADAYRRAVGLSPSDAQAWANLATIYERNGLKQQATEARARAAALGTP